MQAVSFLMHGKHPDSDTVVEEYIDAANRSSYIAAGWMDGRIPPEPEPEMKPLVKYADPVKAEALIHTMHGPDIATGEIVEAEIPADNVTAYKQNGWVFGPIVPVDEDAEAEPEKAKPVEKPVQEPTAKSDEKPKA